MKFGIITLVSDNYGNKYQNYAVEQLLSQYGEVETFGLQNLYYPSSKTKKSKLSKLNPMYIREVLISRPMYRYDINRVDHGIICNLLYCKQHGEILLKLRGIRSERFRQFSEKYLHISSKVLNRENATQEWATEKECFVCGSDQIWNPTYATTSELAFCSFAPEKTVCLSPSFGVSTIPEYRKKEYSEWLKKIAYLSVREKEGCEIIRELTGREAEILLDPTMALPIEQWNALCQKPETILPEKYIVCYFLGRVDKVYKRKIDDFAKKKGLPVVMLFDITTPEYYTFDPAEVLYTIKNAEYVLTDSFHGTVFSILFHKKFIVFERNEDGASMNSRLATLLSHFSFISPNKEAINDTQWDHVESVLNTEKERTQKYLKEAIDSIK